MRRNVEVVAVVVWIGFGEVERPVEQVVVLDLGGCGFGVYVVDGLEFGGGAGGGCSIDGGSTSSRWVIHIVVDGEGLRLSGGKGGKGEGAYSDNGLGKHCEDMVFVLFIKVSLKCAMKGCLNRVDDEIVGGLHHISRPNGGI